MVYIAKKTFAHGKKTFRKGAPVSDIKGCEEKLLSMGLITRKPKEKPIPPKEEARIIN
jgi:hypothetical protein